MLKRFASPDMLGAIGGALALIIALVTSLGLWLGGVFTDGQSPVSGAETSSSAQISDGASPVANVDDLGKAPTKWQTTANSPFPISLIIAAYGMQEVEVEQTPGQPEVTGDGIRFQPHVNLDLACNSGWSWATIKDGRISFEDISLTKMACIGDKGVQEKESLRFLESSPRMLVHGDKMWLRSGLTTVEFEKMER